MSIRNRLKNVLIKKLQISNKEAETLILQKKVIVNHLAGTFDTEITDKDEIICNGTVIQQAKKHIYLLYHKPVGIESTMNTAIENNLSEALGFPEKLFPVGRLDKSSEGLMLLTNDGSIYDAILRKEAEKEKEYFIEVNKPITKELLEGFEQGIVIMGKKTQPAQIFQETATTFRIILTEGLNRQIRRCCYKFDYEVTKLKRTRIMHLHLGDLPYGAWRHLNNLEINELFKLI